MRVAIAHDYLTQRGGAERVVLSIARAFPDAPIYTLLYNPEATYPDFRTLDVRTSVINRSTYLQRNHRIALPMLPLAASAMNIDADVVIASSSGWSHGFRTRGKKIVYCHSPAHWLYQTDTYLGRQAGRAQRVGAYLLRPMLRAWDKHAARGASAYVAASREVRRRIQIVYGRDAEVLAAPNTLRSNERLAPATLECNRWRVDEPYYLCVARLLPYKNVSAVIDAFGARRETLVVVGDGPQLGALQHSAPSNVRFMRRLSDADMDALYGNCIALIAASYEDYGLSPLEAAARGRPSLVLRWGGYLDTVVEGQTGVFFDQPIGDDISRAIDAAADMRWDERAIRDWAQQFSEQAFHRGLKAIVRQALIA